MTINVDDINLAYTLNMSSSKSEIDNQIDYEGGSFSEFDNEDNLIRQINYEVEKHAYRVMKYSFDIWFA